MPTHSPACQQLLDELLTTPTDSVEHRIADYIQEHTPGEGLDYLITLAVDDPPQSAPVLIAARLLPSVVAEVIA